MTYKEMVVFLAQKTGLTQKKTKEVLDLFLKQATDVTIRDGKFSIPQYFTLVLKKLSAREGTNPQTKAKMKIPAKKTIRISILKNLKAKLNK